ncbi:MAG: hypothetical protein ACRDOH_35115 [Streptosporangiaceae bacterium]
MSGQAPVPGGADAGPAGELGLWEAVDAYQRAVDTATAAELAGGGDAAFHLRQVALEAVIERRIAVRAVISIHRALLAGARVPQIARATGLSGSQVAARWAAWAGGQVRLHERTGLGMAPEEYGRAAAVIAACGGVLPDGAVRADRPASPDKRM